MTTVAVAGLLPGVQQFLDNSGQPLVGGTLTWYVQGSQTLGEVWVDSAGATPAQNPTPLDAGGVPQSGGAECQVYGAGAYTLVIKDSNGAVVRTLQITLGGPEGALATVAALRALTSAPASGLVYVEGHSGPADGGEGTFVIAPGDQTSADNGGTIIVDQANNRWYREGINSSPWSIKWFGATGAGVVDDAPAINAAIAAASTWLGAQHPGGGQELLCPSGVYLCNETLAVGVDGITLVGAGINATELTFSGAVDCITFNGSSGAAIQGCGVKNMAITGRAKTGGRGIVGRYVNNFTIRDIKFLAMWGTAVDLSIYNTVMIYDVWGEQLLGGAAANALSLTAPGDGSARSDVAIVKNFAFDAQYSGASGIFIDGLTATTTLVDVNILRVRTGLNVNNGAGTANCPNFLEARQLLIEGAQTVCVQLNSGTYMNFIDCVFNTNNGAAGQGNADIGCVQVFADPVGLVRSVNFVNCVMYGTPLTPVVTYARNVMFIGCKWASWPTTAPNTQAGLIVGNTATDTTIVGCSSNIFGASNNLRVGLWVQAGSVRTIEGLNNFSFSQTAPVLWESLDVDSWGGPDINTQVAVGQGAQLGVASSQIQTLAIVGPGQIMTTSQMLNGILALSGSAGAQTLTTPSAAALKATVGNGAPGQRFPLSILNLTNGTITISVDATIHVGGIAAPFTIPSGGGGNFILQVDNSLGFDMIGMP